MLSIKILVLSGLLFLTYMVGYQSGQVRMLELNCQTTGFIKRIPLTNG